MTKIKLLSISVLGLMAINVGIVSFLLIKKPGGPLEGRPPMEWRGGPPPMHEGPKKLITERLHFDKEQMVAFEKLVEAHQDLVKPLKDSIRIAKNNLYQSLQSKTFAGKDSLVNRLGALQKEIELVHYEHFAELKKLCKSGQLSSFNELTNELGLFFVGDKPGPPPPGN